MRIHRAGALADARQASQRVPRHRHKSRLECLRKGRRHRDPVGRRSPCRRCRISRIRSGAAIPVSRVIQTEAAAHHQLRDDGVRKANAGRQVNQVLVIETAVPRIVVDDFSVNRNPRRRADRIEGVEIEIRLLVMPRSCRHLDFIAEAEVQGQLPGRLPIVLNVHPVQVVRCRRKCGEPSGAGTEPIRLRSCRRPP